MKESVIWGKRIFLGFAAACLCLIWTAGAHAAEKTDPVFGTLQVLTEDVEVKETAEESSAVIGSLSAGTPVILEGEEGEWRKILCQEIEGYVPAGSLGAYAAGAESLEAEMQDVQEDELQVLEVFEQQRKEKRTSILWGTVIAVLILLIYAVGIISSIREASGKEHSARKKKKKKKKHSGRKRRKQGRTSPQKQERIGEDKRPLHEESEGEAEQ